jgi:hypothetical protein
MWGGGCLSEAEGLQAPKGRENSKRPGEFQKAGNQVAMFRDEGMNRSLTEVQAQYVSRAILRPC